MGTAPAFSSVSEAIDIARAALGYLAAADAARLAAEEQADCLRELERTDAVATAALRASSCLEKAHQLHAGVSSLLAEFSRTLCDGEERALITRRSRSGTEVPERVTDGPCESMAEEQGEPTKECRNPRQRLREGERKCHAPMFTVTP